MVLYAVQPMLGRRGNRYLFLPGFRILLLKMIPRAGYRMKVALFILSITLPMQVSHGLHFHHRKETDYMPKRLKLFIKHLRTIYYCCRGIRVIPSSVLQMKG